MKVAIVGGGIAGMGAAYSLHRQHEVTLFEASPVLGGHAHTVEVTREGRTVPVDIGFLIYHDWVYPNLSALFRRLGVETQPLRPGLELSIHFQGGHWRTGRDSAFWESMRHEVDRFQQALPEIVSNPKKYMPLTVEQYLDQEGYSEDFKHKVVAPLLSVLFVTSIGLLRMSMFMVAATFGPVSGYSMGGPTSWRTVKQGSREYVRRLSAGFASSVRTGCGVRSIRRERDGVTVTSADGAVHRFDQVVLATEAGTALKLLEDPSSDEGLLLGEVEYEPASIVLHTDARVMPEDRSLWAAYTYVTGEAQGPFTRAHYNYYLPALQDWVGGEELFATCNPPEGLIDPAKVVKTMRWQHLVCDGMHPVRSAELHRIQGKRRTWFCGEYVGFISGHEMAFTSGLAVGKALGGEFPFEDSEFARRSFYDVAVHHMKVVRPEQAPVEESPTWWPPPMARVQSEVLRGLVEDEVRRRMRAVLPLPQVLRPVEQAVAGTVAGRVSLYDELRKQKKPLPPRA
jgi:hypothetical protein